MISNQNECENAARYLGLRDPSASTPSFEDRPNGCILTTYSPTSSLLGLNLGAINDIPCGHTSPAYRTYRGGSWTSWYHDGPLSNCICKSGKVKHIVTWKYF